MIGYGMNRLFRSRPISQAIFIAALAAAIAVAVRTLLVRAEVGLQYVTLFPAVSLAALTGGAVAGLIAIIFGVVIATALWWAPYGVLTLSKFLLPDILFGNSVFTLESLIVCLAVNALYKSNLRTEGLIDTLNMKVNELINTKSELKIAATAFDAAQGIMITDINGTLIRVNAALCKLTGYEAVELLGRNARIFQSGIHDKDFYRQMWASILQDGVWQGEIWDRKKNGEIYPKWLTITQINGEDGSAINYVGTQTDLSSQKALERDLLRSNEELEQFAFVASHDLRQPLRMITNYLTLIEDGLKDTLSDDLVTYFGFVITGAKRMDMLITDLLQFSRVAKEHVQEEITLQSLFDDILKTLEPQIRENEAVVAVANNFPTIKGNPTEIFRLFQNLISNAIKFHHPDKAPQVNIGWQAESERLLFWVSDNGIGIETEHFERIFKIFQRLVSKEKYEGSGIGLAICKKIVECHGGTIWISSKLDQGTTFFIALPSQPRPLLAEC